MPSTLRSLMSGNEFGSLPIGRARHFFVTQVEKQLCDFQTSKQKFARTCELTFAHLQKDAIERVNKI